jgi:ATP/maltotriose-dependent transcriptional regulator MalT
MGIAIAGTFLVTAKATLDQLEEIPPLLDEVTAAAQQVGLSGLVAMAAAPYAEALITAGREHEAVTVIHRIRVLAEAWAPGCHALHLAEAWLARHRQNRAATETALHAALASAHGQEMKLAVSDAIDGLGAAAITRGVTTDGVRLFAAAHTVRQAAGHQRPPHRDNVYTAHLDNARSNLGESAFDTAWTEGAAMTLEEAVAYASRGRFERKRPPTGWHSLTPAEARVVRLVTAGLSNPEIARLFALRWGRGG